MRALQQIASIVLVVVGASFLASGVVLFWADANLFDTDRVVETAVDSLDSEPVQALLAEQVIERVMGIVGDEAYRTQVTAIVSDAVADPQVHALVGVGVRAAHELVVSGEAEQIPLRLTALAERVRAEIVTQAPDLEPRIPPTEHLLDFDVFERADLPPVWRVADRFRDAAALVVSLGAVLVGLGLVIGPARWLRLVVAGVTFAAFGVASILGLQAAVRNVQDRVNDPIVAAATDELFETFFSSLDMQSVLMIVGGLLAAMFGVAVRLMRPEYSRRRDVGLWR